MLFAAMKILFNFRKDYFLKYEIMILHGRLGHTADYNRKICISAVGYFCRRPTIFKFRELKRYTREKGIAFSGFFDFPASQ